MDPGPELLDLLRRLKRDVPTSLDDLIKQVGEAKSTLHLRLQRLVEFDLVIHTKRVGYSLNDRGEAMMTARPPLADLWPRLPLPSELKVLPDVHRAVIELALCAAAGRYHRVFAESLATFLLLGRGLRLKTLVMRIVVTLAGGDAKKHVLRLFKETAASATVRRSPAGAARLRSVAAAPIVGLDELARAKPEVRDATVIYTFGERDFPEPDDTMLEVLATPIIASNPPDGLDTSDPTADQQLVTGFDSPMRRRMMISDMNEVEIPEALKGTGGQALLAAVIAAGPHQLPKPVFPRHLPEEVVRRCLLAIFDRPDRLDEVDVNMIVQFVAGATAFRLDKDAALRNVMKNVGTIYATRGWVRADWLSVLTDQLAGKAPPGAESTPVVTAPAPTGSEVTEFAAWCVRRGRRAMPAEPKTIVAYIDDLERKKTAIVTIERALAAITVAHTAIRESSPCDARSVRRRLEELRGRVVMAAPLRAADLSEIVATVPNSLRWTRNLAMLLLGVSAALRPEELVTIRIEGLKFTPDGMLVAYGTEDGVKTAFVRMIDSPLCTVDAVAQWIARSGIKEGSVFVSIYDGCNIGDMEDHVAPSMVDRIVKDAVERIGKVPAEYDARSLREGYVVARRTALEEGLQDLDALRASG